MMFLHTADMPRLFSNNKLLSFMVIKFTPLFVVFLTLSIESPCYHGKGQHRNAVNIEILLVHSYHFVWCYLPIAVLPWFRNHSLILRVLEQFCFFSLPPLLIFLHGDLATNLYIVSCL